MIRSVISYLVIVGCVVAFSALFLLIFGNSVTVECLREAGRDPACRLTRRFLGQVTLSQREVIGVTGVQIDEDCDDGCSYRAVLETSSGQGVPVNEVYTDYAIVERQAQALDGFLSGSQTTFEYTEPTPWWVVIMIGVMDLIGLAVVVVGFLRRARGSPA